MKGSWNQIRSIPIITLSFLLFLIFDFEDVFAARARHFCHPEHSDAILKFKNEFQIHEPCFDAYPLKTESWANNSDCCYWDGVTCDDKLGEVIKLDLSRSCLHGQLKTFRLQKLRFLTSLNLSRNHFNGSIPSWISNLSNLASLDFSHNNLDGEIPSSLGYLSHLTTIDISRNRIGGSFPSWIGNLPNLTSIDFSHNNLGGEIPSSLGYLSHLTSLNLSYNNLSGSIPFSIGNLSHLTTLGLSRNNFRGEIPSSLGNLVHLTILSLYRNHLVGEIPSSLGNLLHLTSLDLCCNSLDGEIPTSLGKLSNLTTLVLSDNNFVGSIPDSFGSLKELANLHGSSNKFSGSFPLALLNLTKLSLLSLSYNGFTGTLPSSLFSKPYLNTISLEYNKLNGSLEFGNISSSSKLEKLGLGNNNFRGPIPRSISKLVHLRELDLSNLNTQDSVDISIFSHLNSLQYLDISYLNTTTTIDLNAILSCLKSLDTLDLQGNHVSATNKSSVSNLTSVLLGTLYLKGCGITEFPDILRTQFALTFLDISNNKMKGQVPGWLWMLPFLQYVNLSKNTFIGFERSSVSEPAIRQLFGSNNRFTGNIPSFLCMFPFLSTLDLSKNNFNGSIPRCMGYLQALNLGHNRLSGHLPEDIFESLRSLDVSHNQLAGKLPKSLIRNSFLTVLNVASNKINDTFPFWLSSLQELQVLVLRANAFHGPIQLTQFTKLQIIDISHNQFNGHLPPDCFMNWTAMFSIEEKEDESIGRKDDQTKKEVMHLSQTQYMGADYYYYDSIVIMNKGVALEVERILKLFVALDFSGNKFEGEIPSSIGLLKELRVLNLSNNGFTSHIPSTMGNLRELESLDVSQNKLSGEIPQELGKLSYLAYMDFSHNLLVGPVPGGTQFRRQPCSSFEDNQGLYGPSLDEVCGNIHAKTSQQSEMPEPEKDEEEVLSWIAAALGFVPGVFFGLTMGYMLVYYKPEWFMKPFGRNKRRSTITTTY